MAARDVLISEARCLDAGLDPAKVARLARRLAAGAEEAREMGLVIFGGAGSGSLRIARIGGTNSEVANLGFGFDGGDGGDEY